MWSFSACFVVMLILKNKASSQAPDYETTPFPLPPTSFSCQGRSPGYYADLETGCRTYHVCDGNSQFTYICPTKTLFQPRSRICDHAYLVRCEDASTYQDDVYPEYEEEILLRLLESEDQAHADEDDRTSTQTGDDYVSTTESPELTDILPPLPATTPAEKSAAKPTTVPIPKSRLELLSGNVTSVNYSSQTNKILKFVIKDIRALFYIPEIRNNSVTIQAEREFVLPVDRKNLLRFKYERKARHSYSACPSFCDPKFFLPGACHPCIMIK